MIEENNSIFENMIDPAIVQDDDEEEDL